jgi:hypothetical protein
MRLFLQRLRCTESAYGTSRHFAALRDLLANGA